ncbi:unnamed protein product [Urochloa humidicola]
MRTVAEAGVALRVPEGSVGEASALRAFIERGMHRLRRVAAKLGCRAQDVDIVPVHRQGSGSATRSRRSSAAAGSSSRAPTFSSEEELPGADDSEDNGGDAEATESEDDPRDSEYNEISLSQLADAPRASQPSQRARGPTADMSPSNIISGRREKRPRHNMTPGTDALGKGKGKAKGG